MRHGRSHGAAQGGVIDSGSIMQTISNANFGPLIAYLVPGATVLLGLKPFSPVLQSWFAATPLTAPTIGGFLYLTLASLASGMTVSAFRWVVIDAIHAWTGLPPPELDFARLGRNVEAFRLLVEIHYKYYQHHANMVVALAIAYVAHRTSSGWFAPWGILDVGFLVLEVVFFVTSRDNLRRYYARSAQLLRPGSVRSLRRSG